MLPRRPCPALPFLSRHNSTHITFAGALLSEGKSLASMKLIHLGHQQQIRGRTRDSACVIASAAPLEVRVQISPGITVKPAACISLTARTAWSGWDTTTMLAPGVTAGTSAARASVICGDEGRNDEVKHGPAICTLMGAQTPQMFTTTMGV